MLNESCLHVSPIIENWKRAALEGEAENGREIMPPLTADKEGKVGKRSVRESFEAVAEMKDAYLCGFVEN